MPFAPEKEAEAEEPEEAGATPGVSYPGGRAHPSGALRLTDYLFSHLHTYADASVTYNDNIYLLHDKTGDVVTKVRPGVDFLLGSQKLTESGKPRSFFRMDGGYACNYYINSKIDRNNPFASINLQGVGAHYKISLNHWFEKLQRPSEYLVAGLPGLVDCRLNVTDLSFMYTYGRVSAETRHKFNQINYEKFFARTNNIREQVITTTISVNPAITPRVFFFFEYDHGDYVYFRALDNVNDFKYNQFFIGAKGKVLNKFYGAVKAGKELRYNYSHLNKYKDAFIIRGDLYYQFSRKTWFSAHFAREDRPSTNKDSGFDLGYRASVRAVWDPTKQARVTGGLNYSYDAYTTDTVDNTYSAVARFDYKVNRYATVGLEYNFTRRNSTRADAKYNNSNIITRMGLVF
ncbi:MAG: outer membrane beta-barrel protein [Candidatus Omnitrophica bacterium]|nr:outer membrane beta-barrel protein [Candidatus Omnitrophota bacterium]